MSTTDVVKWSKAKQKKWKNTTERKIDKAQRAKEKLHKLRTTWEKYGYTFEQQTTQEPTSNIRHKRKITPTPDTTAERETRHEPDLHEQTQENDTNNTYRAKKTKRNIRYSSGQDKMKTSWEEYGFTFGQQTRQERNTTTKQSSSTTTAMKRTVSRTLPPITEPQDRATNLDVTNTKKRHRQASDRDKEKRAKHKNNNTPGQHNETLFREQANLPEPKVHRLNRKRKNKTMADTEMDSENDTRKSKRNNNKQHNGTTNRPVKKTNNKRKRYSQISDSSDSSDTEEDRNKDKVNDIAQDIAVEPRKGIC